MRVVDRVGAVLGFKAKTRISAYLHKQPKLQYDRCESCRPLPGDEVIGFKNPDGTVSIHRRDCKVAIRLASQRGDDIIAVNFEEDKEFLYPVKIDIVAIDRFHLLVDLVDCITNKLRLCLNRIRTESTDEIGFCSMEFGVHSSAELQEVINSISCIDGVEEVKQSIEY